MQGIFKQRAYLGALILLAATSSVSAATFTVNSTADAIDANPGDGVCATTAGSCTLRAAIQESNMRDGADSITLPAGNYLLTIPGSNENASAAGDLDIMDDLTINGASMAQPGQTVIDGGGAGALGDRIVEIMNGAEAKSITVRMNGLTIQGGYDGGASNGGGGICNHCNHTNVNSPSEVPTLHLMSVIVRNNFSGTAGAGIANHGTLMVDDALVAGNSMPYGSPATGATGQGGGMGGGIMNWGGTVAISRTTLSGNYAQTGGAVYNQDAFVSGVILITDSTLKDNVAAFGAGVYNVANGDATLAGPRAGQVGLTITRSTISGNFAEIDGGGVYNLAIGTIAMLNSTVAMNKAGGPGLVQYPNRGGGIYSGGKLLDLLNVTVAGNESAAARVLAATSDSARGGDELFFNTTNAVPTNNLPTVVNLQNVIIGNGAGTDDNCNGSGGFGQFLASGGNNIDSGTTCGLAGTTNISNVDPLLGPLANNGGLTLTMAPFVGSPVLNRGANCPPTDQRGAVRDALCDLGAVETSTAGAVPVPLPTPVTPSPSPSPSPPAPVPPPVVTPPPNTAPIARNGVLTVVAGASASGTLVAVDNERNPLTFRIVGTPTRGTATIVNAATGEFSYRANAGAPGTDSFTFAANDGTLDSNVATVTITISAAPGVNTAPVAMNGAVAVAPGATVAGTLFATDADGNGLTYRIVANGSQGLAAMNSPGGGSYIFAANANASGSDLFTFVANDGTADSNVATIAVTYTITNTPPAANDGVLSVAAGATANGTLSASDPNPGDVLSFSVVSDARKGILTILNAATGAYTYTAASNATGLDTFTFKVSDGKADSNLATVAVTITPANAPPSAGNGTLSVPSGTTVGGQLLATDLDGDLLVFSVTTPPTQGTVSLIDPALGTYVYTASTTAVGVDKFAFQASDGLATSKVATVNIAVGNVAAAAVAIAPQVGDLSLAVNSSGRVSGQLPVNNASAVPVTFNVAAEPTQGKLTVNPSVGTFTYRANAGATGVDTFTFNVSSGGVASNTGVVKLVLSNVPTTTNATPVKNGNSAPAAGNSAVATKSGGGAIPWWSLIALLIVRGAVALRRRRKLVCKERWC